MSTMASQITSLTSVYSTFYAGADQRKHQSCASQACVREIRRWPVNSSDKKASNAESPRLNTLPVRRLVVPLSKALHAVLLLSTHEQMGTYEGRFVSRGAKLRVSGCILPKELRRISRWIYADWKGLVTREATCQSLQSRALNLDEDSKQWLYSTFYVLGRDTIFQLWPPYFY